MAKHSKVVGEALREEARRWYVLGCSLGNVQALLSQAVGLHTLARWVKKGHWEQERQARALSIDEIERSILQSIYAVSRGEAPTLPADAIAKYVTALEKISPKQALPIYAPKAFGLLLEHLMRVVEKEQEPSKKEEHLQFLKKVAQYTEQVVALLTEESMGR